MYLNAALNKSLLRLIPFHDRRQPVPHIKGRDINGGSVISFYGVASNVTDSQWVLPFPPSGA